MRVVSTVIGAVGLLAAWTEAGVVKRTTTSPSATSSKSATYVQSAKPTSTSSGSSKSGCAAVSETLADNADSKVPLVQPSDALACLQSVPLDTQRSSDFVDYIQPYIQFQSTLAYLKDPPIGWTLPGVDVLGGLAEIQANINDGTYQSQWEFEVDLYALVNVLPHDFHFNLPMPLLSVFTFFTTQGALVSVSEDGLSLPKVFFQNDLTKYLSGNDSSWTPSALVSIEDVAIADYLEYITQTTSDYQDPDAIYNQAFSSLAFNYYPFSSGSGNAFVTGGNIYGFSADSYTYKFANGTTKEFSNHATTSLDFSTIQSGQDLFDAVDLPPPTTSTSEPSTATATSLATQATSSSKTVSSLAGYPTPVVIHPDGFTSGYFLPNSTIAVLAMQGFVDALETDDDAGPLQQAAIEAFLDAARKAGMTKLIIDLQNNGGGNIFNGFDAFKQLFPTLNIFGASRFRATPAANYLGEVYSATGIYNSSFSTVYQFQSSLDINNHAFSSWKAEDPPVTIYGDNFTQELRYNFTDIITEAVGGINVTGFLSNGDPAPQLFKSEDMVMLYDGSCGSTCTVFSELMKAQGNVRSIALGGRPQYGPMQGVAGSKGAQVYTFDIITGLYATVPKALDIIASKGLTAPTLPPAEFIPNLVDDSPLGDSAAILKGSRFNLRNNMHDGDETQTPLQFVYEASNCKLFYTAEDQFEIQGLWERVADVAWGKGKCVAGSTITKDNTMPSGAYDTVPFGKSAYSTVNQSYSAGLVAQKSSIVLNSTKVSNTTTGLTTVLTGGANTMSASFFGVLGALVVSAMAL